MSLAVREVQNGEVSAQSTGFAVVCECCFLRGIECAEIAVPPVILYLSEKPAAGELAHSDKPCGVVTSFFSVGGALFWGSRAQVAFAVIQTVAVSMISLLRASQQPQNHSMHTDGAFEFCYISDSVEPMVWPRPVEMPWKLHKPYVVACVYDGVVASCQRYLSTRLSFQIENLVQDRWAFLYPSAVPALYRFFFLPVTTLRASVEAVRMVSFYRLKVTFSTPLGLHHFPITAAAECVHLWMSEIGLGVGLLGRMLSRRLRNLFQQVLHGSLLCQKRRGVASCPIIAQLMGSGRARG